jgi:hypothetical protein
MSTLIPAMVASAILGIVTIPIVNLSLETVKTRVDSELFGEAETLALGVRRQAAGADTLTVNNGVLTLDDNPISLPNGCSVSSTEGADGIPFSTVTCTTNRGSRTQKSSQPLFAASDFETAAPGSSKNINEDGTDDGNDDSNKVCYSRYQSQSASNNDNTDETEVITIDDFNALLSKPGNSGGFLQLHTLNHPRCAQAASGSNSGSSTGNNGDNSNNSNTGPGNSGNAPGNSGNAGGNRGRG